jgi:RimJ/RimL family protein N-acetyltransferase
MGGTGERGTGERGTAGYRHLRTGRLDLRPVDLADADALHRILGDPRNSAYLPDGHLERLLDTQAWIERFHARWDRSGLGYWTARLLATGTVIGVGGAERRPEFWNLLYFVDRDHRGNGYATELARAAQCAAAAVDPDLPLVAWIHEGNVASQAVARHLGLSDHGRLEAGHWKGQPMHYWADRGPAPGPGTRADAAPG